MRNTQADSIIEPQTVVISSLVSYEKKKKHYLIIISLVDCSEEGRTNSVCCPKKKTPQKWAELQKATVPFPHYHRLLLE